MLRAILWDNLWGNLWDIGSELVDTEHLRHAARPAGGHSPATDAVAETPVALATRGLQVATLR